ncbi:hypothetical protein ACFRJ8_15785 [Arthrobacter sp. NPDC056886]|uniref:hypothetical protein n=1 Tax=Arthrobacter sp. NPDC056886 TaxID=3345960 RepID=UPI00366C6EDC
MTNTQVVPRFVKYRLRDVLEGQVLRLAGTNFSVVAKRRRDRLVHLDLESDDQASATLIGIPGARVRLREDTSAAPQ